jgi:hypothetical protein
MNYSIYSKKMNLLNEEKYQNIDLLSWNMKAKYKKGYCIFINKSNIFKIIGSNKYFINCRKC